MSPTERDYINFRLSKAAQTLEESAAMLQHGYLNAVVNRAYYACFYVVSALLLTEGHSSSKHSGVLALFDRERIKTGRLPVEMGRFYHRLFESRQRGDYGHLVTFDKESVTRWLEEAQVFVSEIKAAAESLLREQDAQD